MNNSDNGERCEKCGAYEMPRIAPGSAATARRCQNCGYIQELERQPK